MTDRNEVRKQVERIDELVREVESIADPAVRAAAKQLVQAVTDLHGAALERILEIISGSSEGVRLIDSLARDEVISSLLVLYDLHPDDFETRVHRGLEKARQLLARRGAELELREITDQIVRVSINTGGHNCGSTGENLQGVVRDALFETVPDATDVLIEATADRPSGFVPLASLERSNGSAPSAVVSRQ
ncbi:MAG: NifU family protein [Acidobacteriaceae bacterium]|nr:NifU family protein [Acidobacteriaceae bacterium]